jgi:cytoplasmic FMR1 interacting protein
MLSSLAKDIFPNFSYNLHTHRFIPSPIAIRPMQYSKAPKQSAVSSAFGSVCAKVYDMCGRLTRSFFGLPHLEAYLSLGVSVSDLSMLVDQCMKNMFDKIVDVSEYLEALKDGVPPCPPPKTMFHSMQTVGGYGYYEGSPTLIRPPHLAVIFYRELTSGAHPFPQIGKLRSILDYDDLKPEVFQNFREIGNSLAFLTDLSDAIEVSDQFSFLMLAPFLGCAPAGSSRSAGEGGPVTMVSLHASIPTKWCRFFDKCLPGVLDAVRADYQPSAEGGEPRRGGAEGVPQAAGRGRARR